MPRIRRIQAIALAAPWERVFGSAKAVPQQLLHPAAHFQATPRRGQFSTLVRVEAEDDSVGWGECWGLPAPGASAAVVSECLAGLLHGQDADDIATGIERCLILLRALGLDRGCHLEALSGVELALWDRRARAAGQSVSDLLTPHPRSSLAAYASPVCFHQDPEAGVAAAEALVQAGFRALKVKVGRDPEIDLRQLRMIREHLEPDVELLVDANAAWDLAQASTFAEGAGTLDLRWLEEPLPRNHLADAAELRRRSPIPVAAGENAFALGDFAALLEAGAADVLTPNLSRVGGISGLQRILHLAGNHGARVALHGVGGGLLLAATLHCSAAFDLEACEINRLPNPLRDELLPPIPPQDGRLSPPPGPGFGVLPDAGFLARWAAPQPQPVLA